MSDLSKMPNMIKSLRNHNSLQADTIANQEETIRELVKSLECLDWELGGEPKATKRRLRDAISQARKAIAKAGSTK